MASSNNPNPIEEVLATAPASLRELAIELKNAVIKLHPEAYSTAWPKQRIISFGFGPKKMSEHYFYIGIQPSHVNAGFCYGAELQDPHSLLEGTGKNLRHAKIRSLQEARRPELLALLSLAKAERAAHLAEAEPVIRADSLRHGPLPAQRP